MIVVVNKETKDRQYTPETLITDKLIQVVSLVLTKTKKYEELGRLDKAFLITTYLNKIYLILRYWHYSGLPYNELPKCIEESIECSLKELNNKLNILPREFWLEISELLLQRGYITNGIDDLEIIGITKDNIFIDFQNVT